MIFPTTYAAALLLTLLAMLLWGSWANTLKLVGKWRFELYCLDFALGVLVAVTILVFAVGETGNELSFRDNLLITGYRQMAFAVAAGMVFNLGHMLLAAGISVAGISVVFPIGIGFGIVVAAFWSYAIGEPSQVVPIACAAVAIVAGIVVMAVVYLRQTAAKNAERARELEGTRKRPPMTSFKAIGLALACGVLVGSSYPLVAQGMATDLGLRAYSVVFLFGLGIFLSTLFLDVFFMNIPVQGKPIGFGAYLKGTRRQHLIGVAGGVMWAAGAMAYMAAASAADEARLETVLSRAIVQTAVLLSVLWGLVYWKEFTGAPAKLKGLLVLSLVLFVIGLGLISVAPLWR